MQEPPRSTPTSSPTGFGGIPHVRPQGHEPFPPMGCLKLALALFIYPRLAILNTRLHRSWGKCLMLIVVITVVAAVIRGIQLTPAVRQQSESLCEATIQTLGSLTYDTKQDVFGWTQPLKTPVTTVSGNWQICVLDKHADFSTEQAKNSAQAGGLIIARDTIAIWMRNAADGTVALVNTVPKQSLVNLFRQTGDIQEGLLVLTPAKLRDIASLIPSLAGGAMAIATAFFNLKLLLTCVFIFVIMSTLFNRIEKAPFGSVFASSLGSTFPPYALALVASLIPRLPLDMDSYFTIFFLIYLIVIFLDRSVVVKRLN